LPAPVDYLYSLQKWGIKLGLDNTRALCAAMGNPEGRLTFIHLAGTNGKGSTSVLLASIFRAAGYRAGLYTSPHLIRFNERLRINGEPIGDAALEAAILRLRPAVETLRARGMEPTFFEATTVLAFDYFAEQKCDIVILETGMGGRLDSTNIVRPEGIVITPIAHDHERYLGGTLAEIAAEKAGILKEGVPVVTTVLHPEAAGVVHAAAATLQAPVFVEPPVPPGRVDATEWMQHFRWEGLDFTTRLAGRHQLQNLSMALRMALVMRGRGWKLSDGALQRGVAAARWPARFERLRTDPLLVLDGAHNAQGIGAACAAWDEWVGRPPGRILFGCLEDKDPAAMRALLAPWEAEIWLLPIESMKGRDPRSMAGLWGGPEVTVFSTVSEAMEREAVDPHPRGTLILGSLYLAGEILAWSGREKQLDSAA
jgi:dihydrofolate synthase/folylpolyglutamate synthase